MDGDISRRHVLGFTTDELNEVLRQLQNTQEELAALVEDQPDILSQGIWLPGHHVVQRVVYRVTRGFLRAYGYSDPQRYVGMPLAQMLQHRNKPVAATSVIEQHVFGPLEDKRIQHGEFESWLYRGDDGRRQTVRVEVARDHAPLLCFRFHPLE